MSQQIILASNNAGKVAEIRELLSEFDFNLVPQGEFDVPEVEETGTTFVENAIIKARHASALTGLPALADDSGLAVEGLGGEPGVRTARYAGVGASDTERMQQINADLLACKAVTRRASFYCVIVYMRTAMDPAPIICQGVWEGEILLEPQGEQGFGYDPIFYVPTHQCSAAQLDKAVKNQLSHRGQALQQLVLKFAENEELTSKMVKNNS